MSVTIFICWISLATLLSTVVRVTDSCSSTFVGRKPKRTIEIPASSAATDLFSPTTMNYSLMTESQMDTTTAVAVTDTTTKKDEYDLCEGQFKEDFCLNGGTCMVHKIRGDSILYDCLCDSHYYGRRCEDKLLEGSYRGMKVKVRRGIRRKRKILHPPRLPQTPPAKPRRKVHHRSHREAATDAP